MAAGTKANRALVVAHLALVGTMLVHAGDHVRQGIDTLSTQVRVSGALLLVLAVATLPPTLRGDRRAPAAAAVTGVVVALLVSNGHIAPWGVASYGEAGVDALSWLAMLSEVVGAVVLAAVAVAQLPRARATRREA